MGNSPRNAQIEEVRITFKKYLPCKVSLIAKVSGNTFAHYKAKNGNKISMIQNGEASVEEMFEDVHSGNMLLAWALRALALILIIGGLKLMFEFLQALTMVLPFLGNIVGGLVGIVCTILGFVWFLIMFEIAGIVYRPVLGIGILLVAGALIFYLIKRIYKIKININNQ